eukprot:3570585-Prymnesium_polylepis.1
MNCASSRSPLVGSVASRPPSPLTGHHPEAPPLLVAPLPSGSLPALAHTSSGLSPSRLSLHSQGSLLKAPSLLL